MMTAALAASRTRRTGAYQSDNAANGTARIRRAMIAATAKAESVKAIPAAKAANSSATTACDAFASA